MFLVSNVYHILYDSLRVLESASDACLFQLIIYAGPNTNAKKVAEYGGNTYGFGSRSVLGSGWPKDLVKVCVEETCMKTSPPLQSPSSHLLLQQTNLNCSRSYLAS